MDRNVIAGARPQNFPEIFSFWGDSRTAQNFNTSQTQPSTQAGGQWIWAGALGKAFSPDYRYNFGVSGDDISELLGRLLSDTPNASGIKPSRVPPSVAHLLIGTNSIYGASAQGLKLSDLITQFDAVVAWLESRGHIVIPVAETFRGNGTTNVLTADDLILMLQYMAHVAEHPNAVVVRDVVDVTKSDGTPYSGFLFTDSLHLGPPYARSIAREVVKVYERLGVPQALNKLLPLSNGDKYGPNMLGGCLNTNPMLNQGAGGVLGAGAAGVVPEGYTLSATSALAVTGSFENVVINGRSRRAYKMVISGTPSANNAYAGLRQTGLLPSVTPGVDDLLAGCEVYVASGYTNMSGPCVMLDTALSSSRLMGLNSITGYQASANEQTDALHLIPTTPKGKVAVGSASLSLDLRMYSTLSGVAASQTIYLLSAFARKV